MSSHTATVVWERRGDLFLDLKYSRRHEWSFDGGCVVPGSASPLSVRTPYSDPGAVDPEEAFVASLSSCHMLWFLSLAAEAGVLVDRYEDNATGTMASNEKGQMWIATVELRPLTRIAGACDRALIAELHLRAHEKCFIAHSIRSSIIICPAVEEA